MNKARRLSNHLRNHALPIALVYAAAVVVLGGLLIFAGLATLTLVLSLIAIPVYESWTRLVFRLAYGRHYRYSYTPYLFHDHADYGNALRAGTDIKQVRLLLFDKYIFHTLPPPLESIEDNIGARFRLRINRRGYRGGEFSDRKTQPLRIFCSGGSTTACYGDDTQTWPAQLEQSLAARGRAVEVINGGVWGWTSTEELRRLSNEIDTIQPDVVLLHQGWNEEFLHAALRLGETWQPGVVRSLAERELCVGPGSRLARVPLVSAYLIGLARKRRYFARHMAFTNRNRWRSLLNERYIKAWIENLASFCRLAAEHRFLLYTVNPPSLVTMDDERTHRRLYIRRSRLTHLHADYQAVSKHRVTQALRASTDVVPCLDIEYAFETRKADERAALFRDELHLSPAGDALLAGHIADMLVADKLFCARHDGGGTKDTNVKLDSTDIEDWLARASRVDPYIGRFVVNLLAELNGSQPKSRGDVPDDMYTTF